MVIFCLTQEQLVYFRISSSLSLFIKLRWYWGCNRILIWKSIKDVLTDSLQELWLNWWCPRKQWFWQVHLLQLLLSCNMFCPIVSIRSCDTNNININKFFWNKFEFKSTFCRSVIVITPNRFSHYDMILFALFII